MPKVTFVKDYRPKGQAEDIPSYKAGESYELELSYAEKYKSRGYAVDYVAPVAAVTVAVEVEAVVADEVVEVEPPVSTTTHQNHPYRGKRR